MAADPTTVEKWNNDGWQNFGAIDQPGPAVPVNRNDAVRVLHQFNDMGVFTERYPVVQINNIQPIQGQIDILVDEELLPRLPVRVRDTVTNDYFVLYPPPNNLQSGNVTNPNVIPVTNEQYGDTNMSSSWTGFSHIPAPKEQPIRGGATNAPQYALGRAVAAGDTETVTRILADGPESGSAEIEEALMVTIALERVELAEVLVSHCDDPEVLRRILLFAVSKGMDALVAALVRARSRLALDRALGVSHSGASKMSASNKMPLMVSAVMDGGEDVIAAALRAGASVNLATDTGETPLFIAAQLGRSNAVKSLCEAQADVNLANYRGETPLAAAVGSSTDIQRMLQDAGARFNGQTHSGEPSVVAAVRHGALSVLTTCLKADDKPDSESLQQALWWAVASGRAQCVEALLRDRLLLTEREHELPRLACLAAYQGHLDVLIALAEHDADIVHASDPEARHSAVDYAAEAGHDDVVEWLSARGVKRFHATLLESIVADASLTVSTDASVTVANSDVTNVSASPSAVATGQSTVIDSERLDTILSDVLDSADDGGSISDATLSEIERFMLRLRSHAGAFVFTHILPTGRLGVGAVGEVSRGSYFGRDVAFKIQHNIDLGRVSAGEVRELNLFAHEARMLAVVAEPTHRHCAGYLGVAVSPDVGIAIVTEYVSGGNLRGWLRSHGHFDTVDGLELLAGLASGLAFLHGTGVVHGDIKPDNILLEYKEDGSGRVYGKWIDLGGGYPYWRGRTACTPRYASPEQLCGELSHAGSDVFSFACVILEVLSGERPDHIRYDTGPPLQRNLNSTADDAAVAEAMKKLPREIRRLLPGELGGCTALVELLVACWQARVYSRPRTHVVFETLIELLVSFDAERAAALTQQLEETAPPPSGNSALLTAVQYCDIDEVKRLVAEGARADDQNQWGHTPLHVAATVGDIVILKTLLSTNPELLEDSFGITPIELAQASRNASILHFLHSAFAVGAEYNTNTGNPRPLHDAVVQQDMGAVMLLLQGGADVNALNSSGETALHVASRMNAQRLITVLVEHGADVSAVEGKMGRSALHAAASAGGNAELIILLHAGAEVDLADADGMTALMLASETGNVHSVSVLLDGGANVNEASKSGLTALMIAARGGYLSVVDLLVRGGADLDASSDSGTTALWLAAAMGHADCVATLLSVGVDPAISPHIPPHHVNGPRVCVSPLDVARERGHGDVVMLLSESSSGLEW